MAREGTPDRAREHQPFARLHLQIVHIPHAPFLADEAEAWADGLAAADEGSKVMKAPGMAATRRAFWLFMAIGFEGLRSIHMPRVAGTSRAQDDDRHARR
jgi:hypothetical protein